LFAFPPNYARRPLPLVHSHETRFDLPGSKGGSRGALGLTFFHSRRTRWLARASRERCAVQTSSATSLGFHALRSATPKITLPKEKVNTQV
jgi:hypothetical protein